MDTSEPKPDHLSYRKLQECVLDQSTGNVIFRYDGLDLVTVTPAGEVTLDSHDAVDRAVFQSMNDALGTLGMRVTAPSGRYDVGDWSISDGRSLQRFADGMKLPAKGIATTGRAQQLLQGMRPQPQRRPHSGGNPGPAVPPPQPMQGALGAWHHPVQMGPAMETEKPRGNVFSRLGGLPDADRRLQAQGRLGPGKKWEHYELNKNGKPVRQHMHVKTGDLVQVIAGHDKGTVGRIESVQPKMGTVRIEDVNTKVKHVKPKAKGQKGFVARIDYPIHHSNVAHYSEGQQVTSRIGHKVLEDGRKVRYLKKTGEVIDKPRGEHDHAHVEEEAVSEPAAPESDD